MTAAALLQVLVFVAIGGTGALCGFIAAAVCLRKKRRARRFFALGVLTGLMAATVARRRYPALSVVGTLARGFVGR